MKLASKYFFVFFMCWIFFWGANTPEIEIEKYKYSKAQLHHTTKLTWNLLLNLLSKLICITPYFEIGIKSSIQNWHKLHHTTKLIWNVLLKIDSKSSTQHLLLKIDMNCHDIDTFIDTKSSTQNFKKNNTKTSTKNTQNWYEINTHKFTIFYLKSSTENLLFKIDTKLIHLKLTRNLLMKILKIDKNWYTQVHTHKLISLVVFLLWLIFHNSSTFT